MANIKLCEHYGALRLKKSEINILEKSNYHNQDPTFKRDLQGLDIFGKSAGGHTSRKSAGGHTTRKSAGGHTLKEKERAATPQEVARMSSQTQL